ncbi:MAG: hypothetical protein ACXITV_01085 [Luteibaculaceae bacterium]
MKSKNYFFDDFKNPIFLGLILILLFINKWGALSGFVIHILYVSWLSNTIKITEHELIFEYPNWVFWNRVVTFKINEIKTIKIEHSVRGAYATIPYFDIYKKNNKKTRITYSPSITKEEFKEIINLLKMKLGSENVIALS